MAICEATVGERLMELDVANMEGCFDHSGCIHRDSNGAGGRYFKYPAETEAVTVMAEAIGALTST